MQLSRLLGRSALVFLAASLSPLAGAAAAEIDVELASGLDFELGESANGYSFIGPSSGSLMPLGSLANNLIDVIDVNSAFDAYLFDLETGTQDLISQKFGQPGQTANQASGACCVSADGRFVLINSRANDIVAGSLGTPHPDLSQVYLFDRESRAATLLSHVPGKPNRGSSFGAQASALSADGQLAIFTSPATDLVAGSGTNPGSVFLFDRGSGEISLIGHAAGSPAAYANGETYLAGLSEDSRFILLSSTATNLVAGVADTNGERDLYLYDRRAGELTLVTHAPGGRHLAMGGAASDFSADGRYLLVSSKALLATGMTDGNPPVSQDCFLWDRQSGLFRLLSHHFGDPDQSGNVHSYCVGFSRDGRFIYFESGATDLTPGFVSSTASSNIFLLDRDNGGAILVSHNAANHEQEADSHSYTGMVSSDGRFLVYQSYATDLESGITDTNGDHDVYRYDRSTHLSTLISRIGDTTVAGQGRSYSTGKVDLSGNVVFSSFGQLDPGARDDNQELDAFLFDGARNRLLTATTTKGRSAAGTGNGSWSLSDDNRWVLWDDHIYDQRFGKTERVAHRAGSPGVPANGASIPRRISADGRYVLLESLATDLAAGTFDGNAGSDVYRYDRSTDTAVLLSHAVTSATFAADNRSTAAWLSPDGQRAVLGSRAGNLVAGGFVNGFENLYFWDQSSPVPARISHSHSSPTEQANGNAYLSAISEDERFVLVSSTATNLVPAFTDTNGAGELDAYLYDRATSQATLINRQAGAGNAALPGTVRSAYPNGDWSYVYFGTIAGNPTVSRFYRWSRGAAQVELLFSLGPCPMLGSSLDGMTPDGRHLLISTSCGLVSGDVNGIFDVYLYDRTLAQFQLITHWPDNPMFATGGFLAKGISSDGRTILYQTMGIGIDNVAYSYDRVEREATAILPSYFDPEVVAPVRYPVLSRDGNYVVLGTLSANGAPYDANGELDALVVNLGGLFLDGFESGNTAA